MKRYPVMYNDFVVIGPRDDPAGIKGKDVVTALQTVKTKAVPFVSRGDHSGTHIAELKLWTDAGIDIGHDRGSWYKEIGQGMGAALNMAKKYDDATKALDQALAIPNLPDQIKKAAENEKLRTQQLRNAK